jgi:hypothetical protein
MDPKHTISDSKIASEPESIVELCTIIFKDNITTVIPKNMISRFDLLIVQEPKDNIYDLHTVDISYFMYMFDKLHRPARLYELHDLIDGQKLQVYNYLMIDNKAIGTVDKFVKILSNYIHNRFVEQKFTTDKKILDTYPVEEQVSIQQKYTQYVIHNITYNYSNEISIYRRRHKNDTGDYREPEVLCNIPDKYIIRLKVPAYLFKILNIPSSEFKYYGERLYDVTGLNVQMNKDNLKYTVDELHVLQTTSGELKIIIDL